MSSSNHAGNIILNLAGLPEFLRNPILRKRLVEFFSMTREDKKEVITNALLAGPTIEFDKFSTLFKTWLEILSTLSEEQRKIMFSSYINEILRSPEKIVAFNLDGIFEIYMSLSVEQRSVLSESIRNIVRSLEEKDRKKIYLIIPGGARNEIGV